MSHSMSLQSSPSPHSSPGAEEAARRAAEEAVLAAQELRARAERSAALEQWTRAKDLTAAFPVEDLLRSMVRRGLIESYLHSGHLVAVEPLLREELSERQRTDGPHAPLTIQTLLQISKVLKLLGRLIEAEMHYRDVLEACHLVGGEDRLEFAEAFNDFGEMLCGQGKLALARRMCSRAVRVLERHLPRTHPQVLRTWNNLGAIANLQKEEAQALTIFQKNMEAARNGLPAGHPYLATYGNNLADSERAHGRLSAARSLLEEALAVRRAAFGVAHPLSVQSLANLGSLAAAEHRFRAAEMIYRELLELQQRALPAGHPQIAMVYASLAESLAGQRRFDEALPLLEEVRKIFAVTTVDPARRVGAICQLAEVYAACFRWAEAQQLLTTAWDTAEANGTTSDLTAARIANGLGRLRLRKREHALAKSWHRKALEIQERLLGETHLDLAGTLLDLAAVARAEQASAAAETLLLRAEPILERRLGANHPRLAGCLTQLSECLLRQGQPFEADALARRALAILEAAPEPDPTLQIPALHAAAESATACDLPDRAEFLWRCAIDLQERTSGTEDPTLARPLARLGELLVRQGISQEAESRLRRSLALCELGPVISTAERCSVLERCAEALLAQERYGDAEPLLADALARKEKLLGADHPDLAVTLTDYARVLTALGDTERSQQLDRRAHLLRERGAHVLCDLL